MDFYTVRIIEFVVLLIIAGISGGLARALFGFGNKNFLVSLIVGVVGSYIGLYLYNTYRFPSYLLLPVGQTYIPVDWSTLGAFVFVFIVSLVWMLIDSTRRRSQRSRPRI